MPNLKKPQNALVLVSSYTSDDKDVVTISKLGSTKIIEIDFKTKSKKKEEV